MKMAVLKTPATYSYDGWSQDGKTYLRDQTRVIEVGQGCTTGVGSDCYPYHVSRISDSGKTVWIKRAHYHAAPEHDYYGEQKYIITPNPDAPEEMVRKRKNGGWKTASGSSVAFGVCRAYQDPHF